MYSTKSAEEPCCPCDAQGLVRCVRDVEVAWNEETVREGIPNGPKAESSKLLSMDCGPMEAGVWKVR